MAHRYPLFLDMEGRLGVVVGGGAVGERKCLALREARATVRVVGPTLTPELERLVAEGAIQARTELYRPEHLAGATLAFACTDQSEVNTQVVADARAQGILVNAADAAEVGDFVTPAVVRRGDLALAVTAGGFPMLAARIARELEAAYGPEYRAVVELLHRQRVSIKQEVTDASARRRALSALFDRLESLLEPLRRGEMDAAQALAQRIVHSALAQDATE